MTRWVKIFSTVASICTVCRAVMDSVTQTASHAVSTEGETVTLACGYKSTSDNPFLLWYKQRLSKVPVYLLGRAKYGHGDNGTEFSERFQSKLNLSSSSVPLTIRNLQVSDSAVYYCALQPTVTTTPYTPHRKAT
ncbi:hypothetical protein ACEWY4_007073 [Coilia grayii]|uniref:Ig-like domain-containing protein n=1 Tax=Coilia grayii TaxID=363190 RepID=A0ABD1KFN1_9TELE